MVLTKIVVHDSLKKADDCNFELMGIGFIGIINDLIYIRKRSKSHILRENWGMWESGVNVRFKFLIWDQKQFQTNQFCPQADSSDSTLEGKQYNNQVWKQSILLFQKTKTKRFMKVLYPNSKMLEAAQ